MQCNCLTLFQAPMALILTSVKWWGNYVDTNRGFLKLFELKKAIQLVRTPASLLSSMWNIIITLLFVCMLKLFEDQQLGMNIFITSVIPATRTGTFSAKALSVLPSIIQVGHHLLLSPDSPESETINVPCHCPYTSTLGVNVDHYFAHVFVYCIRLLVLDLSNMVNQ